MSSSRPAMELMPLSSRCHPSGYPTNIPYIDHLSLPRSLKVHNSIPLNEFNSHVGISASSFRSWSPPLPGLRVPKAKLSPILLTLVMLGLDEGLGKRNSPGMGAFLLFHRATDISVQGGPIRGSKAILRFTVSRFPSSGQSVYFYGVLNHTFHCPCHKNDLRGSFGVCKNHCHNSLGKLFPLANEAKVQLNVRDYFPRLRLQGRPCLMSSYIYHFSA